MGSNKIPIPTLILAIITLMLPGCAGGPGGSTTDTNRRSSGMRSGDITIGSGGLADLDLGEDWDISTQRPLPTPQRSTARGSGTNADLTLSNWTLVLFTYTDQNHAATAKEAAQRLRSLGSEFLNVRTHTSSKGSMVLFGSYMSREDPAAKADMTRLRALTSNGQRVFPQVILTHIEPEPSLETLSPYDLRVVRQLYPNAQQLFTLDVAVWSTFDNPDLNYGTLKQQAEAYCRELRAGGYEAYFHHNESAKTSSVTVGVFGPDAVDPRSGIYSPQVMKMLQAFPTRLNNEQILQIPIDRFHPNRGTRPQKPALVEVPK
ncbi:MAG: SPOR domain-containing protein [Planctomycetes bacterium]|nr:SPOR domain-containing protein [Planctomycetota bacterium]